MTCRDERSWWGDVSKLSQNFTGHRSLQAAAEDDFWDEFCALHILSTQRRLWTGQGALGILHI